MLFFSLVSTAYADLIPARVSDIPLGTLGVYQPSNSLKLYSKPDIKSNTLFNKTWNYISVENSDYADTLFAVLIPKKGLSFIYATDIDEDFFHNKIIPFYSLNDSSAKVFLRVALTFAI